ncbi:platelet basic protein precursor [Mus musculus]|uniref:Chemokine subfamily B Cys-X-Cys n=1 Tax=Mus musculus TaxID=10090 RepID=Q9EQI5_MOUSE|nr:platelet basic protein precursor [Mus musculus]AAG36786.1 thymus chemokine 1 [Mus musculus]AAI27044.1 Pro-platelet basic protein [Mus musculus]AAI27045.1 Pro-platelet basic protein [Mus musculus]AAK30162.1 platelet basic protein [Mus musculus]AAK69476.1 thymus chemokine 1 [Mus musculus]|eukprot:NP_076274.1 platelet basic protein precursor [Mus musculus]
MGFRLRPTSSCTRACPLHNLQILLLLGLILVALAPLTAGKSDGMDPYIELRCRCTNTISGIPFNSISLVNVYRPGVHCADVEVIATLKNGQKTCLDPNAPGVKRIVMKILEGY